MGGDSTRIVGIVVEPWSQSEVEELPSLRSFACRILRCDDGMREKQNIVGFHRILQMRRDSNTDE